MADHLHVVVGVSTLLHAGEAKCLPLPPRVCLRVCARVCARGSMRARARLAPASVRHKCGALQWVRAWVPEELRRPSAGR